MSRFSVLAHVVWEGVLLVLALVVTILGVSGGHVVAGSWPQLAILGTLAGALALSVRTGTPNLAVASIASVTGLVYGALITAGWPVVGAGTVAVLIAFMFGVVMAVTVGLTGAPAWAVSLGGVAVVGTVGLATGATPRLISNGRIGSGWLTLFAVLFVVGSVAGGALWLLSGVVAGLRATAVDGEPAPGIGRRLLAALVGLGASSLLAGLAGVLQTGRLATANFTGGQGQLLFALGAALLGGVSLTGRGGGVAGTVLSAYLLVTVQVTLRVHDAPSWAATSLPSTVAILLGVIVSRVLDLFGHRIAAPPGQPQPAPYLPGGYPHLAYPLSGYRPYPPGQHRQAAYPASLPGPAAGPAPAPTAPTTPAPVGEQPVAQPTSEPPPAG